jgi:hypothetical protein
VAAAGRPRPQNRAPPAILAPSSRKKFVVTPANLTCSGVPSSLGTMPRPVSKAAKSSKKTFDPLRKSMKLASEKGKSRTLRLVMSEQASTNRFGSL